MLKAITISAVLILSFGAAYAQNATTDGSVDVTTTPVTTTPTTTDTTGPVDTTGITNGTTNGTPTTGVTTGTGVDTTVTTPSTTGVTTTPSTTGVSTTTTTPVTTSTATTTTSPTAFTCVGNNPTWNLSISKQLITYSSAKDPSVKLKAVNPMTPIGDATGTLQVFSARANNGKPVTILIKKNDSGCTNGLPGQSYQYDAFVVFSNMVIAGCCNSI